MKRVKMFTSKILDRSSYQYEFENLEKQINAWLASSKYEIKNIMLSASLEDAGGNLITRFAIYCEDSVNKKRKGRDNGTFRIKIFGRSTDDDVFADLLDQDFIENIELDVEGSVNSWLEGDGKDATVLGINNCAYGEHNGFEMMMITVLYTVGQKTKTEAPPPIVLLKRAD